MTYRKVGCIPAGRRRYMEVLVPYLLCSRGRLDHIQLWANTLDAEDLAYIHSLQSAYPGFFRVVEPETTPDGCTSICPFWRHVTDPDTIYIRTDDDIVWIAPGAIETLMEYRLNRPDPFLVFGNIVNNAICSHIHQRQGCIPLSAGLTTHDSICPMGWKNPRFAEVAHRAFLQHLDDHQTHRYLFGRWIIWNFIRFSINVCSWFGKDFRKSDADEMRGQEEYWVTCVRPRQLNRPNEVCGQALFSHFAFFTQRKHLDETDILEKYRVLSKKLDGL